MSVIRVVPVEYRNACTTHRYSVIALSLLALLVACSDSGGDADDEDGADPTAGSIDWLPCNEEPMLDCAVMLAPLVHTAPDGRTIAIDLVRLPSTGDQRAEPLLMNPGGPGDPGTDLVRRFHEFDAVPAAVRERHDIVGFDPRGIGSSDRIDCEQFGIDDLDAYPTDRDDVQDLVDESKAVVDACVAEYGDRLSWLGSNSVVRDMDLIRQGLDAERLHFIGYSYGSRLAALYLQQFPAQSGRFVLDGSTLPSGETEALVSGQARGYERNLERMLDLCGTRLPDCRRDDIERDLMSRLQSLFDEGDEAAFDTFGQLMTMAVEDPRVAEMAGVDLIRFVLDGELAPLARLVESFDGEADRPESYTGVSMTVQRAVICADDPVRPTVDSLVGSMATLDAISDLFGEALLPLMASCVGWPESLDPVYPILTRDAPVSLVVGGESDANTLIEWAPVMADAIGGVALMSDHPGHTAVFSNKSVCVDAVVLAYLLDGTLPERRDCLRDEMAGRER